MSQAARVHAEAMFAARQLSHQFDGEPSLPQRLAATTHAQLDQEGENVALDFDAAERAADISCFHPRIAPTCSTRPITWSGWAWSVAATGCTLCRTSAMPSPTILAAEVKDRIAATVSAGAASGQASRISPATILLEGGRRSLLDGARRQTRHLSRAATCATLYRAYLHQPASGDVAGKRQATRSPALTCEASRLASATRARRPIRRACTG